MTCRDLLMLEDPECVGDEYWGARGCPDMYGYLPKPEGCSDGCLNPSVERCRACWDREIPVAKLVKKTDAPHIKDSGDRTEFSTGAVRDMHEGKGRCDLMPLDVVARCYKELNIYEVLTRLADFQKDGNVKGLYDIVKFAGKVAFTDLETMFLEVAKHFEEGAKKYGENNWQKGIPVNCYVDSAVRHYLKWLRGDQDERHDRAFCWNILCCIWTCEHMPELNPYRKIEKIPH